jgi:phage baseplate assembly protein gpV
MKLVSPTLITLQAPTITLSGNVGTTGTLMNNGVNVGSTHVHINGGGTGDSGPPAS